MIAITRLAAAVALTVGIAAHAQTQPAVAAAGALKARATVEAIDQATRMVTLRAENGETVTFKAGPEIKNLAQVKQGDVVTMEYVRAVALELQPGGSGIASRVESSASGAAKPGERPAGVVTDKVVITAPVRSVDTANRTVTVMAPNNRMLTLDVRDPAVLAKVKVGDTVRATYSEALLISVAPPAK